MIKSGFHRVDAANARQPKRSFDPAVSRLRAFRFLGPGIETQRVFCSPNKSWSARTRQAV
jgi:hypothetical protein